MDKIFTRYNQLSAAANIDEYLLHLAAWEWSVIEPIIIRNESDIQSQKWRECGLKPFKHQFQNLIYFFRKMPCALIADDVGLGKTISAALILSELISRKRVQRALIIAPKILCHQWKGELYNLFGLDSYIAENGKEFEQLVDSKDCSILITTYGVFRGNKPFIGQDSFQMAIFDEAHKLRNLFGVPNPPQIAKVVEEAFEEQIFKYVLMLTATPVQNRIWDIYSLIHLLKLIEGEDNPLGRQRSFQNHFLADSKGVKLHEDSRSIFRQILQKTICRTRRGDTKLPFPGRIVHDVPFELKSYEKELYNVLKFLVSEAQLPRLQTISLARGLMSSPQAFLEELKKNHKNLTIIDEWLPRVEKLVDAIPVSQKMEKVLHLLEEMRAQAQKESRSWRAIIFTMRRVTQKQIAECLKQNGFLYDFIQGGNPTLNRSTVQKYKCEPPIINVIVSTDSGAEGVNLQEGNVIINYDLPWNPMIIEQRIGRVQRLGSKFEDVVVFNPYAKDTIEEEVVERLVLKLLGISQAIGDLESILDISGREEDSFEKTIEDLVLSALKGQNIEGQKQKIEEEVVRAARYYEEHKHELDETLSATNWNEELSEENLPPEIEPQHHSMTEQEFLTKAWEINQPLYSYGGKPFGISEKTWNRPEELRNSREFIDRIQEWRRKASSFVYDLVSNSSEMNEWIEKAWSQLFPETQVEQIIRSGQTNLDFQGQILFRSEVSNSVNRFQKVLSSPVVTLGDSIPDYSHLETNIPNDFTRKRNYNGDIAKMVPDPSALAQEAVDHDEGLQRFAQYYYKVLEAKQAKTENQDIQRRNEENFMPRFSAEMCGIQGFTYEVFPFQIHFLADSHPYWVSVQWIPLTHSFQPIEAGRCEVTGIECPNEILEECQLTYKKVLPHLLITIRGDFRVLESETAVCGICHQRDLKSTMEISPVNHLWEHIAHKIECDFSHKMGFPEEMETSDLSGRTAFSEFVRTSDKSGRKGIIDEFVQCAKTNKMLLADEVMYREADRLWYDADLFQKSAVSGRWELAELMCVCEYTWDWAFPEELAYCCISGQYLRRDLTAESRFSHRFFRKDLGITAKSGELLPPDEVCPVCELPILRNEERISHPNYERMVHADHFVKSAVTGNYLLKEEAKRSDYSGNFAEPEYFLTSDLSNRCGFESETFLSEKSNRIGLLDECIVCSKTGKRLLKDEVQKRKVDGLWYDKDLFQMSVISKEYELEEFMEKCELTNLYFFPSELVHCCISGKKIRKDFATQSYVSGKYFLSDLGKRTKNGILLPPDEICPICELSLLQDEKKISHPNYERMVHAYHFVKSVVTGNLLFKEDAKRSDYSGKYAEPEYFLTSDFSHFCGLENETFRSEKTNRIGLLNEGKICAKTGKNLLIDEGHDSKDGQWYDSDLMQRSEISDQWDLKENMVQCEQTGAWVLPDELLSCCISGKKIRKDLMCQSPISNRFFYPGFGIKTADGELLPPDEVCPICELPLLPKEEKFSHPDYERMVHADHFVKSAVTGNFLRKEDTKRSDFSGKYAEPEYFLTSDFSHYCGLESEMFRSEKSNRLGLLNEGKICAKTGKKLLFDEGHDSKDGQWYDSELMQRSEVSAQWDLKENMAQCEQTGAWVLPEELLPCCISGKMIRKDLMCQSSVSNRFFYLELGIKTADGKLLPPDEVCPVCKMEIRSSDSCVKKASTGQKMHSHHFVKSSVSGKIILKTEALCSDYSKKYAEKSLFQVSSSGRIGLPDEFCICAKTKEHLLKDEALFSNRKQCWYKKELCRQSEISNDWGLAEDLIICEQSHKKMFPEEGGICVVSGQRVAKRFLRTSSVSGKTYLPNFGVMSTDNLPLLKSEAEICHWQCGYIPKVEAGKCSLCGLVFSKKFLIGSEFKYIHDLHLAITTSKSLMFRWPIIEPQFRSLLYNSKKYQPDFDVSSPSCSTSFFVNGNQRAFMFCTQMLIRKSFFHNVYVYYFGLAHIQNNQVVLLHTPLRMESSCDIWNG